MSPRCRNCEPVPKELRAAAGDPSGRPTVGYRVEGEDPFGYGPLPARLSVSEIAARTAGTDYPDAPWQICEFFRSPRDRICNYAVQSDSGQ